MSDIKTVYIKFDDIEHTEYQDDKRIVCLNDSRTDIEWGTIYQIEIIHGLFRERFYGFFGYRRDRIIEC